MDRFLSFKRLRDAIQQNPPAAVAALLIVVSLLGCLFVVLSMIPALSAEASLTAQVADGRKAQVEKRQTADALPVSLNTRIAAAQATLSSRLEVFSTEAQVGQVIDALYRNARTSGVIVTDLQSSSRAGANALYQIATIKVQVQGSPHQVLDFASRIKETSPDPLMVNMLAMQGTEITSTLFMEVSLFTSIYASGLPPSPTPTLTSAATRVPSPAAPVASTPTPRPAAGTATPNPRPATPTSTGTATPTSTATATPSATPTLTPTADPNGYPTRPGYILYTVVRGDTMASIAARFSTTVRAIQTANGLLDTEIYIGERLYIPAR